MNKIIQILELLLILASSRSLCSCHPQTSFSPPSLFIFDRLKRDFLALTRKSTTRHILLPKSTEAALTLKQKIRNKVSSDNIFIIDAFSRAAARYSLDESTKKNGGLLGRLTPQGYISCPELDEACFTAPLGDVYGPIESEYGYHLVLVCERTNCRTLDGENTRVIRGEDGQTVLAPAPSSVDDEGELFTNDIVSMSLQQVGFWMGVGLAGGIVAELAAKTAGVVESLPWEDSGPF